VCSITKNTSAIGKVVIASPIVAVLLVVAFIILAFTAGVFWKSETTSFEDFYGVDSGLNSSLKIAGMTLDEIVALDINNVNDFYYSYNSVLGSDSFEFKGHFYLSQEDYYRLKTAFTNAPEFKITHSTTTVTGIFEIIPETESYISKTSVDVWRKSIIEFSDTDCSFYFDLSGICYT